MWPVGRLHASAIGLSLFATSFNLGSHLPSWKERPAAPRFSSAGKITTTRGYAQPPAIFSGKSRILFSIQHASFELHRRIPFPLHLFPTSLIITLIFESPQTNPEPLRFSTPFCAVRKTISSDNTHRTSQPTLLTLPSATGFQVENPTQRQNSAPFPSFSFAQYQQALEDLIFPGRVQSPQGYGLQDIIKTSLRSYPARISLDHNRARSATAVSQHLHLQPREFSMIPISRCARHRLL